MIDTNVVANYHVVMEHIRYPHVSNKIINCYCYFHIKIQKEMLLFYQLLVVGMVNINDRYLQSQDSKIMFDMISTVRYTLKVGANTVKWTTLDLCLVFNESDSTLYIDFEFCEEKSTDNFKNILINKAKQITMTKKIPRKSLHIFRRRCKRFANRWY